MLFLDVQKAKCKLFSVECLMCLSNYKSLSLSPGTFHFAPKDLFLLDFYLLEKSDYDLVKGRSENLASTCLETLLVATFLLMTALVGCGCLGGPQCVLDDGFFEPAGGRVKSPGVRAQTS